MRSLSKNCKLERSRGVVLTTAKSDSARYFSTGSSSVAVVKTTTGSRFLCLQFLLKLLIKILPLCLFFSYFPVISLGSGESMNFELSVPLLWLVVFDVAAFSQMVIEKKLFKGLRGKWVWLLFPVFVTLSLIWSLNRVRGILTVGIMWLLVFAGYAMWSFREIFDAEFRAKWLKWLLGSTLFVCGWCLLQCVLDLVGVSRDYSLMCAGCTYQMFGFPHPNGFAIEPQFMGNLLLAPAMVAIVLYLKKQNNKKLEHKKHEPVVVLTTVTDEDLVLKYQAESDFAVVKTTPRECSSSNFILFCFFVIITSLFLTFSRGAIYAFTVGLCFMTGYLLVKKKNRMLFAKRMGVIWLIVAGAFLFTLNLQGVMAAVSPTNDTYMSGVAKVLNHLSLGIIDIRGSSEDSGGNDIEMTKNTEVITKKQGEQLVENYVEKFEEKVVENSDSTQSVFDGYVAESTEVRMQLTHFSLRAWSGNVSTVFVGSGIGGAGVKLFNDGLTDSPKEIVQNEYASLLLETGLIGISLFALMLVLIVRIVLKNPMRIMILGLLVAYGVSLLFFSGFANALHIYLLPMVLVFLWSCDEAVVYSGRRK